jgi:hypothetical protein
MFSLTVAIKKESIRVDVPADGTAIATATATMTGKDQWTRLHATGVEGVKYASDPPVSFSCSAAGASLYWGIVEGSCKFYNNRRIVLTRDGATLGAAFYLQGATEPLFTTALTAGKPERYTLYRYGGEQRARRE